MNQKTVKIAVIFAFLIAGISGVSAETFTDDSYFTERGVTNSTELIDTDDNATIETQLDLQEVENGNLFIEFYNETSQSWMVAGASADGDDDPFHDWNIYCGDEVDSADTVPEANASTSSTCFNNEVGFYGDTFDWTNMNSINNDSEQSIKYRFKLNVQSATDSSLENDVIYSQPVTFNWTRNNTRDVYFQNPDPSSTDTVNNWTTSITTELHAVESEVSDIGGGVLYIENYDNSSGQWNVAGGDVNEPYYNWSAELSGLTQEDCAKDLNNGSVPAIEFSDLCDNQRIGFQGATAGWSIWNAQDGDMKNNMRYRYQVAVVNSSAQWMEGENIRSQPKEFEFSKNFLYETTSPDSGENVTLEQKFNFTHPWSPLDQPDFITEAGAGMLYYDYNQSYWRPTTDSFFPTDQIEVPSSDNDDYSFLSQLTIDNQLVEKATASFRFQVHDSTNSLIQKDGNAVWYSNEIDLQNITSEETERINDSRGELQGCDDPSCLNTVQIDYDNQAQKFIVPYNVTEINVTTWGSKGGKGGYGDSPGLGGRAKATIEVEPGQVLYLFTGDNNGFNGGGNANSNGGGGTDLRLGKQIGTFEDPNRLLVAGGGGGAGDDDNDNGGAGGGLQGGSGQDTNGGNAGGGNQTAGGAGAGEGEAGSFFYGGDADYRDGAGGGGWYGGGGNEGGAGGGGSAHAVDNYTYQGNTLEVYNFQTTSGVRDGYGKAEITYNADAERGNFIYEFNPSKIAGDQYFANIEFEQLLPNEYYKVQAYRNGTWEDVKTFETGSQGNANPNVYWQPVSEGTEYTDQGFHYRLAEAGSGDPVPNPDFYLRHGVDFKYLDSFSRTQYENHYPFESYARTPEITPNSTGNLSVKFPAEMRFEDTIRASETLVTSWDIPENRKQTYEFVAYDPQKKEELIDGDYKANFTGEDYCSVDADFSAGKEVRKIYVDYTTDELIIDNGRGNQVDSCEFSSALDGRDRQFQIGMVSSKETIPKWKNNPSSTINWTGNWDCCYQGDIINKGNSGKGKFRGSIFIEEEREHLRVGTYGVPSARYPTWDITYSIISQRDSVGFKGWQYEPDGTQHFTFTKKNATVYEVHWNGIANSGTKELFVEEGEPVTYKMQWTGDDIGNTRIEWYDSTMEYTLEEDLSASVSPKGDFKDLEMTSYSIMPRGLKTQILGQANRFTLPTRKFVGYEYLKNSGGNDDLQFNSRANYSSVLDVEKTGSTQMEGLNFNYETFNFFEDLTPPDRYTPTNPSSIDLGFQYNFPDSASEVTVSPQIYVENQGGWNNIEAELPDNCGGNIFSSSCIGSDLTYNFDGTPYEGTFLWRFEGAIIEASQSEFSDILAYSETRRMEFKEYKGGISNYRVTPSQQIKGDFEIEQPSGGEVKFYLQDGQECTGEKYLIETHSISQPTTKSLTGYISQDEIDMDNKTTKTFCAYSEVDTGERYVNGLYTNDTFDNYDDRTQHTVTINQSELVDHYPKLEGAKLNINETSKVVEVLYEDLDQDVVGFTESLPQGVSAQFGASKAVIDNIGESFEFSARPIDSTDLATNTTQNFDLTISEVGLRPDPSSEITVDKQVLRKDVVVGNAGDPISISIKKDSPPYVTKVVQDGDYQNSNFTGGKTASWIWNVDGVNVSEGQAESQVDRPIPTLSEQHFGVPTFIKNNLPIGLQRLTYQGETYSIPANTEIAVSNNTSSGDFINESISGWIVDQQDNYVIGERYDTHTNLQVEETGGNIDWRNVRTNYTVDEFVGGSNTPARCKQINNTKIDLNAGQSKNISVNLGCMTGKEVSPAISTENISTSEDRVTYEATLRVFTDNTKEGDIIWEVPKSTFDAYFTSTTTIQSGSLSATVDGKTLADSQVADTGDTFKVTVPDDFGNSSLEAGDHESQLQFVAEGGTSEPPGDDPGDDPGGGDDPDEPDQPGANETTIEFENATIEGAYGSTVTKSFDITNKKDDTTFVTIEVPDTPACQYLLLQSSRGSDNFGKIATYELPASSSGASSQETEISVLARFNMPTEEQLENSDASSPFNCELETSASTGVAGGFHLTGDPYKSAIRDIIDDVNRQFAGLFGDTTVTTCDNTTANLQNEDCPNEDITGSFTVSPSVYFGWFVILLVLAGVGYRFYKETYAK